MWTENETGCHGVQYNSAFSKEQIFFQYQRLRKVIDPILTNFDEAKLMCNTADEWQMVDCNQVQFEFTNVNGKFDKLYKSSDPADNELAQEISKKLQDKMQKYNVILAEPFPYVPDFDYFDVRPEFWRSESRTEFKGYNPYTGERYVKESN
jgi:hypothetical protein